MITELGLLDRDLADHQAMFGVQTKDHQQGVAYPAVFVVDDTGRIVDKRIQENYRAREGVLMLLQAALDIGLAPSGQRRSVDAAHVTVTVETDAPEYVRWQASRLHVTFDIEPGWHVYGHPVPDGYIPVTVDVETIAEVTVNPAERSPTRPFRVKGLDEQFHVHDGRFELQVPFAVNVPAGHGSVDLKVTVQYQACSESECLPPAILTFELRLSEGAAA